MQSELQHIEQTHLIKSANIHSQLQELQQLLNEYHSIFQAVANLQKRIGLIEWQAQTTETMGDSIAAISILAHATPMSNPVYKTV